MVSNSKERSNNKLISPLDFSLNSFGHQERYTCPSLALHPLEESFVAQTNGNYMAVFTSQQPYRMNKRRRYEGHKVSNNCCLKGVEGVGGCTVAVDAETCTAHTCTKLWEGCRRNLERQVKDGLYRHDTVCLKCFFCSTLISEHDTVFNQRGATGVKYVYKMGMGGQIKAERSTAISLPSHQLNQHLSAHMLTFSPPPSL